MGFNIVRAWRSNDQSKRYENKIVATKILFDWEENGRNRAKQIKDEHDAEIAERCRECGMPDSQFHVITECITKKLTDIRIDTEARIDMYIQKLENEGNSCVFHKNMKRIVQGNLRTEKLRLGMWEMKDIMELSNLEIIKSASELELNQLRTELENMNSIYYLGCRKLIREKQKMDWEDRNPNMKGKKKRKANSYRKENGCKKRIVIKRKNKMDVNEVLGNGRKKEKQIIKESVLKKIKKGKKKGKIKEGKKGKEEEIKGWDFLNQVYSSRENETNENKEKRKRGGINSEVQGQIRKKKRR